jgi:hypothetical protein
MLARRSSYGSTACCGFDVASAGPHSATMAKTASTSTERTQHDRSPTPPSPRQRAPIAAEHLMSRAGPAHRQCHNESTNESKPCGLQRMSLDMSNKCPIRVAIVHAAPQPDSYSTATIQAAPRQHRQRQTTVAGSAESWRHPPGDRPTFEAGGKFIARRRLDPHRRKSQRVFPIKSTASRSQNRDGRDGH